jgi:hypothetical protein
VCKSVAARQQTSYLTQKEPSACHILAQKDNSQFGARQIGDDAFHLFIFLNGLFLPSGPRAFSR